MSDETENKKEETKEVETTSVVTTDSHTHKETVDNIPIELSVVLGTSKLRVNQLLKLGRGAVVELDKAVNEPVEIYANDVMVAKGDVIVTDEDMLGISLIEVINN